jgi:hypothetical protein
MQIKALKDKTTYFLDLWQIPLYADNLCKTHKKGLFMGFFMLKLCYTGDL